MRIIKRGVLPSEKIYRGTCLHCSTQIEATAGEGKVIYDQRDGTMQKYECPLCKSDIWGYEYNEKNN